MELCPRFLLDTRLRLCMTLQLIFTDNETFIALIDISTKEDKEDESEEQSFDEDVDEDRVMC